MDEKTANSRVQDEFCAHKTFRGTNHHWEQKHLPEEIVLKIFSNLDLPTLAKCAHVCRDWNNLVQAQSLWKERAFGLPESDRKADIFKMRDGGDSWKESFRKNHGTARTRRLWSEGFFSKLHQPTLERTVCPMSVDEWGMVLEKELSR